MTIHKDNDEDRIIVSNTGKSGDFFYFGKLTHPLPYPRNNIVVDNLDFITVSGSRDTADFTAHRLGTSG